MCPCVSWAELLCPSEHPGAQGQHLAPSYPPEAQEISATQTLQESWGLGLAAFPLERRELVLLAQILGCCAHPLPSSGVPAFAGARAEEAA